MGVIIRAMHQSPTSPIAARWWEEARSSSFAALVPAAARPIVFRETEAVLLNIWDWWDLWREARSLSGWAAVEGRELEAEWVPDQP